MDQPDDDSLPPRLRLFAPWTWDTISQGALLAFAIIVGVWSVASTVGLILYLGRF